MGLEPTASSLTSFCNNLFATSPLLLAKLPPSLSVPLPTELMLFFFLLFLIGIFGIVLNRKNLLTLLMSIELLLLAINLLFIFSSLALDSFLGLSFSFFVLLVAAAESAVGLSLLVAYFRVKGSIAIQFISLLRG